MFAPVEKILNDAVYAPSGENCQPWRFVVDKEVLSVFNVPEADTSLYNVKQRGSYLAHGALLENISISAGHYGYSASFSIFPNKHDDTHVADVVFAKAQTEGNSLYSEIKKRHTNRKDFTGEVLSKQEKEMLSASVTSITGYDIVCIDTEIEMKSLGKALALHEKVLFEHKMMHDFFYDHIFWDDKDESKGDGFYIKTLEFLPHQLAAVKLFKSWKILSVLNKIFGIANVISKDNAKKYASSGTVLAIMMPSKTNKDYVYLGMSVQRMWLTATKLSLAVHPCNGTLYLMEHIYEHDDVKFTKKHSTLIRSAYKTLVDIFSAHDKQIGFIVRIGKADLPTAYAKRLAPKITYVTS